MSGQSLFYHSWVSENLWFPTVSSPSARRLWRTLGAALGGWGSIAQRLQSDGPMEGSAVKQEVNSWGFSAWLSRGACFLNQFTLSHIPISWLISTWSGSPLLALCCSIFLIRGKYWTFLVYCYCKDLEVFWICSWAGNSSTAWHESLFLFRCCGNLGASRAAEARCCPSSAISTHDKLENTILKYVACPDIGGCAILCALR